MATPTTARTRASSHREQAAALVAAALRALLPACDRRFPYSAARADAAANRVGPDGALLETGGVVGSGVAAFVTAGPLETQPR